MPPIGHRGSLEQRFWGRVQRSTPDRCWEWTGAKNDKGYGQIGLGKTLKYAHRVSYELHHNVKLKRHEFVLHVCDNPSCVPTRRWYGLTHDDNMQDMISKGRDRKALGTDNGRSRLTPERVVENDRLICEGQMSLRAIARHFGVSVNTIIAIKKGVTWSHVTGRTPSYVREEEVRFRVFCL